MSPSTRSLLAGMGFLAALMATEANGTQLCDQWQLVNPLPAISDLLGATHGNGLFILVGREGTIVSSPDEVGWRLSESVTTHDLHSAAWTGARFVAVGVRGTVVTSEDGFTWTLVDTPATSKLLDLAMGPLLVAVGSHGTILSSPDGLTWTSRDSGVATELRDVAWTGTEFLAVGDGIDVLASSDGMVWSTRDTDNGGPFNCIASNTSTTVAVAEDGSSRTTSDGETWTRGWAPQMLSRMVWGGDRFIAVGNGGSYGLRYSFDGLDWTYGQSGSAGLQLNALATDGQITVAGGVGGAIAVTRDGGEHVKPVNTVTALDLFGVASNGSSFVISAGTPMAQRGSLLVSDDGLNWEIVYNMGLESLNDVAVSASFYVTVGVINELWSGGAMILRSPDGRSWSGAVGTVTGAGDWPWEWHSISWDGGRFVIAGGGGTVGISDDASTWHLIGGSHITDHSFFGVASDGQSLVAVGSTGAIAVSHDGQTLTMSDPGYGEDHLFDVAWGNGMFAAVGSTGTILTSTTGDQWEQQNSGTTVDLQGVRFTGERFVVVGDEGTVLTSDDGVVWQPLGRAGAGDLLDVIEFDSELIAIGRHGLVMRSSCSDPDQPPTPRFGWRPALPETGTPVHFIDLTPGDPATWHWEFGDGETSIESNPTHIFGASGDWPVTLTVENEHGSATASAPVAVRPFCGAPPAAVLTGPPSVASGETYELSWNETLLPEENGTYKVSESTNPDFDGGSLLSTWIFTSTEVTHRWAEGGSFFHRVTASNSCPDGLYRSPASNTVRVDIEPDVTDLGDHVQVIAAAAHGSGLKNTSWVSDIVIHNPDRHAAPAYLFLLPRNGSGPPVASARHWVEAGQSLALDDAVADLMDPGAGAVLVASDRPLMVGSRTFNDQPGGSYGLFMEGVPIASPDTGRDGGRLIQLSRNDRYRTNLALANPSPDETTVVVDIHDTDGDLLGSRSYTMPGLSSILDTDFLIDIGQNDLEDASAVVSSDDAEASWVALASVVDNESGDPVAIPTLHENLRHRVGSYEGPPLIREHYWTDLLFVEGIYIAAGWRAIAWSRDGITWHEAMTFEHDTRLKSLAWNGSQILAFSSSGVYSSDNGISWSAAPVNGDGYRSVAWDGSRWVGLGDQGSNWGADWTDVGFSDDGLIWDRGRIDGIKVGDIIWADDRFVAKAPNSIATSLDGLNWQIINTFDAYIRKLAWSGRQLIALGRDEIFTSTDFEDFIGHPNTFEYKDVVWAGDHWVVSVGTSANGVEDAFLLSDDGVNWTSVPNPGPWLHPTHGITWDGTAVLTVDFRRRLTWLVSDGTETTIPAVAHLNGHGGSRWRSDVELHNPESEPLVCSLELVERDLPGLEPERVEIAIGAASSLRLPDVLGTQFEFEGAGVLTVVPTDGAVMVSSRTYANDPAGTYGQQVPALRATDAIHVFETGRLIQLRHSPGLAHGFRTNIGLASRCSTEMEVVVDLYLGTGEILGTESVVLPPMGAVQLNRVFDRWTDEVVPDGFAVLSTPTPTCAFHAYASVVDNRTHDPILVPAKPWPSDQPSISGSPAVNH